MKLILFTKSTVKNHLLKWAIPVILIVFLVIKTNNVQAQSALGRGSIAFIAMQENSNSADTFAIVLLTDITSGTEIRFTDGNWDDGNNYITLNNAQSEWVLIWQATTAMTAGTKVQFWANTKGSAAGYGAFCSAGSIVSGRALSLTIAGDQIFAFQGGTIDTSTNYRITGISRFLAGIHLNVLGGTTNDANWDDGSTVGTSTSELPDSLVTGTHCIRLDSSGVERQNAKYTGTCNSTTGTVINNKANWSVSNTPAATAVCSSPTNTTWNGTTWSNGAPSSTLDAIIASSTTPGAFTCEDLTINSTYDLTLGSGVTATIYGDVTNNGNGTSGVGTLRFVKSGTQSLNGTAFSHAGVIEVATGATLNTNNKLTLENGASLMHGTNTPNGGGSVSGNITFEKTIGSSTGGWRMFGLPVDTLINSFEDGLQTNCNNFNPSDRRNVYYYDPVAGAAAPGGGNYAVGWVQADSATARTDTAYSIYLSNSSSGFFDFSGTVRITGRPKDGNKTYNLGYNYDPASAANSSIQRGWNMIPNHFPSNLGIYNLINDANFGSTYKAVHIWNQGTSQMVGLNQSTMNSYNNSSTSVWSTIRQISPFTAFWVKATSTSQSIQVKNSMRISRTDSLPTSTYYKNALDIFTIEVKDNDGWVDYFSTCFDAAATDGMDYTMDLYKFKSLATEVPTLYTMVDGDMLSFSAMPIKTSYSVPVYIESYTNGKQYTIRSITDQYADYYDVELVDNKTGAKTNLLTTNYTFNHDAAYKNARFTLNFSQKATVSVDEIFNQEKTWAFTNENGINVTYQNKNELATATVEIYNMLGQQLYASTPLSGDQTVTYKPAKNEAANVYIVKVISNGKAQSIKVAY